MSGFCLPGEMTAILGPSGSGKTVLLDVLSARKKVGYLTGEIRYSSQFPTDSFLRKHTGYVEQFSSLIENLTVYEMLLYTAQLKVIIFDLMLSFVSAFSVHMRNQE